MKCKVCGAESGKYPLCQSCNIKKEQGEIIKCAICGNWHYAAQPCVVLESSANEENYLYEVKKTLISKSEQGFYAAIKAAISEDYSVFPQINLATFISRTDGARFQNELFRNVDFLITDSQYQPKLIIEINDQTHLTAERRERDEKVHKICEEAGIPIVKLWTSYGVNPAYIKEKIEESLNKSPIVRVHHFSKTQLPPQTVSPSGTERSVPQKSGGCYVATCIYGSYDCPQVWVLRRYRDYRLSTVWYGKAFVKLYYCVSPILVKLFGNQSWFRNICGKHLDSFVRKLQLAGYKDTPYTD